MAEHGAFSAAQHGRHPPPFIAERSMPDCIDTAMETVKAPRSDAAIEPGWEGSAD